MPKRATYGSSGPAASTDPAEYVLVESFRDGEAGGVHVNSDHFRQAMRELPKALASTPKIISQTIDATGWSAMGEMTVG